MYLQAISILSYLHVHLGIHCILGSKHVLTFKVNPNLIKVHSGNSTHSGKPTHRTTRHFQFIIGDIKFIHESIIS